MYVELTAEKNHWAGLDTNEKFLVYTYVREEKFMCEMKMLKENFRIIENLKHTHACHEK